MHLLRSSITNIMQIKSTFMPSKLNTYLSVIFFIKLFLFVKQGKENNEYLLCAKCHLYTPN